MPAIITHHLFGHEVYRGLSTLIGEGETCKDAFLLGNIGPDPLFCLRLIPAKPRFKNLGRIMHLEDPRALLAAFHSRFIVDDASAEPAARRAFALGFLCHYLLDSAVHPLVYAQQYALCDAGIDGLDREHGCRETHALIETEFDEYVLATRRGETVSTFAPHKETLRCPRPQLADISRGISSVSLDVYALKVPERAYSFSVSAYRRAQRMLDAERVAMRSRFDCARLAGPRTLHVHAMTHEALMRTECAFANDGHFPWPHPFDAGQTVRASFDELYDAALERATELLPRFACGDALPAGWLGAGEPVNFSGQRL